MLKYIIYEKPFTTIYSIHSKIILKHHITYVINQMLHQYYNDLNSYIKNYKKMISNTYHIPIFINAQTSLIVVYGYRNTYNLAINVFSIKHLQHLQGMCQIIFDNDSIMVQKSCKYLKKMIEHAKHIHTKLLENIFIG